MYKICIPYKLVVNHMACYSGQMALIFSLLSIVQFNVGCSLKYEVNTLDLKKGIEEVFCEDHPNMARADSLQQALFYIIAWHSKDLKKNVVQIEARENNESPILILGEAFQEGDTFNFRKNKWKILKIGNDGVELDGREWCRGGFIHIKQI
jgi:hypothetical protein